MTISYNIICIYIYVYILSYIRIMNIVYATVSYTPNTYVTWAAEYIIPLVKIMLIDSQ